MIFRFTLKHVLPIEGLQFANNEFESSLTGWDQIGGVDTIAFTWNNPSSARASGASPDTAAIGQQRPNKPDTGWPPGTYTVAVTATNASTGGSAPLQSQLHVWGSDEGTTLDTPITYTGTGTWDVGAGEITRTIVFTLTEHQSYLFFKFTKNGSGTGYNVNITIDTIEITAIGLITDDLVISEPDGWNGAKIKWERHPDFFSLIEYYEGAAGGAFIFYGKNESEGIDGGIEFIREVEQEYGFDAHMKLLAEVSYDDITYSTIFLGQLDISAKNEMKDNKMQVPVIRDDFWAKFINRFETPVSLSSLEDLDGNAVDPVEPIEVSLTSQVLRQKYDADSSYPGSTSEEVNVIVQDDYYQMSFDEVTLEEIEEVFVPPQVNQTELPSNVFELRYAGTYSFEIQTIAYDYAPGSGGYNFGVGEDLSDYIRVYININGTETEFALGDVFSSVNTDGGRIYTLNLTNQILPAGSLIRIYGRAIANLTATPNYLGDIRWNGRLSGLNISLNGGASTTNLIECFCRITADTTFPATQAPGYLIHDAIHGVLARIGLGTDPFYSEFLGGLLTTTKQYDADGCGWNYAILKGIHIRGYTLTEDEDDPTVRYSLQQKAFFISMKELWDGINPILNLGLGYETIDNEQVIRIEQKSHFIGSTKQVNFSNVRDIEASYDNDFIFKTVKTGYKEWRSDQAAGLDDPQSKHTYATRLIKAGKEINLESEFIAAALTIEQTRRTSIVKSADYKYDDKTFIISLNTDDISPDVYIPELDENFSSVTGLLNSSSRYNLILTPLRNLLRWADYLSGCLQSYLTSSFKFVSGEGNYDMSTTATLGSCARAVLDDNLSESDDISLATYQADFGYFFLPILYNMNIPMEKEDFDLIDRKEPIGISMTESGHAEFHIKELEYDIVNGGANIKAWPKVFFDISPPEQVINTPDCGFHLLLEDGDYILLESNNLISLE